MRNLTYDEMCIISMSGTSNRQNAINELREALLYMDDLFIMRLTKALVDRLEKMTDAEYEQLDKSADYE